MQPQLLSRRRCSCCCRAHGEDSPAPSWFQLSSHLAALAMVPATNIHSTNQALEHQNIPAPTKYLMKSHEFKHLGSLPKPVWSSLTHTVDDFLSLFHPFLSSISILLPSPSSVRIFSPQNLCRGSGSHALTSLKARSWRWFWSSSSPATSLGRCTSLGGRNRTWHNPKRATCQRRLMCFEVFWGSFT